jgi:outer membrane protein assembly factor BamD (BamD/ComL family)
METAYFALANIYRLQLKEPARAVETYEKLLARFPRSKHAAEAYYTLYLLYREANDPKQNQYASQLKQQFPQSRFARLIDQPDYMARVSAGNMRARSRYDSAFTLFENQQYDASRQMLSDIRQQFPDSDLNDKVAFLEVRITGQTGQPAQFKEALEQFLQLYPASPLAEKARQYLAAIALYESGKLSEAEFDKTHPSKKEPAAQVPAQQTPVAGVPQPARTIPTPRLPAAKPAATGAQKPQTNTTPPPVTTPAGTQTQVPPADNTPVSGTSQPQPAANPPGNNQPATNPAGSNQPAANPADNSQPAATPPATSPAHPKFADVNLQAPHVVVIAYPKGQAAFAGIAEKVQGYNSKYNAPDKLTTESLSLNPQQDLVVVRQFANVQKAKVYVSKQKTPQSPLSKIRGIEFVTFVVSMENLPLLLQQGKLEEYLTFYKNNY